MRRTLSRLGAGFAALVMAGTLAAVAGPSAAAADTCAGSRIGGMDHRHRTTNELIGKTGVYRSGDVICVVTMKQGSFYNRSTRMDLAVLSTKASPKYDSGMFLYQAGPRRQNRTGACVRFDLTMWSNGVPVVEDFSYQGWGPAC